MTGAPIRVLFVCTHNSARSIMAEALLREHGGDRFDAFSAGVEPTEIRPLTRRVLEEAGIPTGGLYSKSVHEFAGQRFDYVITVCDQARESCPVFPGTHRSRHWSFDDPSEAQGSEQERLAVFERVFAEIGARVNELIAPVEVA